MQTQSAHGQLPLVLVGISIKSKRYSRRYQQRAPGRTSRQIKITNAFVAPATRRSIKLLAPATLIEQIQPDSASFRELSQIALSVLIANTGFMWNADQELMAKNKNHLKTFSQRVFVPIDRIVDSNEINPETINIPPAAVFSFAIHFKTT